MHPLEQVQCFAGFKIGNGHVWQSDSSKFTVFHSVAYHLVTSLGHCVHWSCELSNLHIPKFMCDICRTHMQPTVMKCAAAKAKQKPVVCMQSIACWGVQLQKLGPTLVGHCHAVGWRKRKMRLQAEHSHAPEVEPSATHQR